ncbi:probable E3 ubiquitin-protein ligase XBOS34 [Setaria italica]|uniref:probable E3 ubiquitin-protein ligase XBOS34 n=1 Tax=Setaria italica TaxID=4555 RepID=UPI0006462774|nr:probable E3 ubiquitin-protein ligase XBOS34 [Setaria italica]XP_012699358.1 probable E3 ubiquitin-protein ligase XBOS34 [Setaria italica]
MREKYAPCYFMKRMIWAVVLPYELQNPTRPRPLKLLLAIYLVSQNMPACKSRAVIELWQSQIEKNLDEEDPCITIFDKETEYRYEILSADEGDKEKLQQFYDACDGITQAVKTDPTPILDSSPTSSSLAPSELLAPSVDDVELAMAINASIQSVIAEGVPNVQPTASTANMNDRGTLLATLWKMAPTRCTWTFVNKQTSSG